MLIICYFVFIHKRNKHVFIALPPSKYPMYPIYLMYPLYLIHLMHLLYPLYLMHPMHPHHLFITITITAPNIRTMPMARLTVKGSLNTKMPMSTAVRGSKAPRMAVGVDPTYLAA